MSALSWFDRPNEGGVAGIYQLNTGGGLDRRFSTIRRAYLHGRLTLRETTSLQNFEVELRRLERRNRLTP